MSLQTNTLCLKLKATQKIVAAVSLTLNRHLNVHFESKSFHWLFKLILYNFGFSILQELLLDAIFFNNSQQDNFTKQHYFSASF